MSSHHSAVAAGRDIRDSIVAIGLDEHAVGEHIERAQRPLAGNLAALTAEIAREKGIDAAPLRAILARLGDSDVSDDTIPVRLSELADRFVELRTQLANESPDSLRSTRAEAVTFLDAGDFPSASAALERGRLASRSQRENAARDEAKFLSDIAHIDELQVCYMPAAEKYGEAAALVADNPRSAFQYLAKQATALQNQGEEFADREALNAAVLVWSKAKELSPFDIAPDDHRKAHNNLGSAIYSLGIMEGKTQFLWTVVEMNKEVLARETRDSAPIFWAAAQAGLGAALLAIGEREQGTEHLWEGVAALREALTGIDPAQKPLDWSGVQNNIGNALMRIAQRLGSEEQFAAAIAAFQEALRGLSEDSTRSQLALTLSNQAAALIDLGRLQNRPEPLMQAVRELEEVLRILPRDRYPMQWAVAKNNISSALNSLGLVKNDVSVFRAACQASHDALTVFTRESMPLNWAMCTWGIGIALKMIAERTGNVSDANAAVTALSEAHELIVSSDDERAKPNILQALNEALSLQRKLRNERN